MNKQVLQVIKNQYKFQNNLFKSYKTFNLNQITKNYFARKVQPKLFSDKININSNTNIEDNENQEQTQQSQNTENTENTNRKIKKQKPFKSQLDMIKEADSNLKDNDYSAEDIRDIMKEEQFQAKQEDIIAQQSLNKIEEHMYSQTYDQELEKAIEQKIAEGKSNQQIMDEILGKSRREVKKFKQDPKYQEQLEQIYMQDGNSITSRENPLINDKISKELDSLQEFQSIVQKNKQSKNQVDEILEKPVYEYQKSSKLSKEEKDSINFRMAIMQENIRGMSKQTYKQQKDKIFDLNIMQEGDKNRITKQEQRELLEKISEQGVAAYSNIIKDDEIPRSKLDLKVQYLQEANDKESKEFKDLIQQDRDDTIQSYESGNKDLIRENRFLDNQLARNDSFTRQKNQLQKIIQKYNIDENDIDAIELFQGLQKEDLFQKVKLQEENQKYQEYLRKKQKIKEFKKYENQLNENKFKDNLDYDNKEEKISSKIKRDKETGLVDTDHIDKLNEMEKYVKYDDTSFDFHKIRTENNVKDYIQEYFTSNSSVVNAIFCGQSVMIEDVFMNDGLTVVYIFWRFSTLPSEKYLLSEQNKEEFNNIFKQQEKYEDQIHEKLQKHGKYLSGKLCKDLGFKYGPQIRIFKSIVQKRLDESQQEIKQTMPDVVKQMLVEDLGITKITKKEYNEIIQRYEDKAMSQIQQQMGNEAYLYKVKSKKRKGKFTIDEDGKIIRNNRTEDGKRKKYQKKNKSKIFWDNLQA